MEHGNIIAHNGATSSPEREVDAQRDRELLLANRDDDLDSRGLYGVNRKPTRTGDDAVVIESTSGCGMTAYLGIDHDGAAATLFVQVQMV